MAGIIAHTVGVIAAATASGGLTSPETRTVTVEGSLNFNSGLHGYDNGGLQGGSIDNSSLPGGVTIEKLQNDTTTGSEDFRVILSPTGLDQDYFLSIDIEHAGGTLTLNTADADAFNPTATEGSFWRWDSPASNWTSSDDGVNRDVTFN